MTLCSEGGGGDRVISCVGRRDYVCRLVMILYHTISYAGPGFKIAVPLLKEALESLCTRFVDPRLAHRNGDQSD